MSMDRFIRATWPKHYRNYRDALSTAKNLKEISVDDLATMPRVNLKLLEQVSGR